MSFAYFGPRPLSKFGIKMTDPLNIKGNVNQDWHKKKQVKIQVFFFFFFFNVPFVDNVNSILTQRSTIFKQLIEIIKIYYFNFCITAYFHI